MEVFGELKNAYLEKDNTGKTALGAICCGDNITSEFDATLTATPKVMVGNGAAAKRLIVKDELSSSVAKLEASDSALSDRIATIEDRLGVQSAFITAMMPSANETFTRVSRNSTSLFIDASQASGGLPSIVSSYMTLDYLSQFVGIPFGVESSLLISGLSVHTNANPFLVGLNAAFNESWPAKGLSIYENNSYVNFLLFTAQTKTVHSQHAMTMSNLYGSADGTGFSGIPQIRIDTTSAGVKSFFAKSSVDDVWVSVPSTERINASVSWLKNMLWSGSTNFNPYSFIASSVGIFTVRCDVYRL